MILDLKRVFANADESIDIDYAFSMSDFEICGVYPLKNPVIAKGRISNRASVVSLWLEIKYEYCAPCDRCGTDTVHEYTVTVDKSLVTALERQESDTIIEVAGMKLDVDELVYSEVVLSLPTKTLCKDTCKGICQYCGKNLNEGECDCKSDDIDPRLSALAELLKN